MSDINNRETIKSYFVTNALPTEEQFAEFIEAFVHKHHETDERVGLGTADPKNILDVKGNVIIGGQYAGQRVAPDDGLLVEGKVGIGTEQSPEAELQVNGNVRFDNGGLTMGGEEIINSAGEWVGEKAGLQGEQGERGPAGPAGPQGTSGTSSWTDSNSKVTTQDRVGVGTSTPATQLEVDGYVTKQNVGFTVENAREIGQNGKIVFDNVLSNISNGWSEGASEFKAPEAGAYFFTASFYPNDIGDDTQIVLLRNHENKPLVVIWDSKYRVEIGTASLVIPLGKGDSITMNIQSKDLKADKVTQSVIKSINFTGYRL